MRLIPTRAEAIARAAATFEAGRRIRDSLPVEEAARQALRHGGPSFEELCVRIAALRGETYTTAA